jgi:transcriptional regulator with XRE-family HTH domain
MAKINWKRFGKSLKDVREAADLGLREAARDAGLGHATWCRAEQGKVVSAPHYLALCAWMEVHPFRHFQ